jgi:hypothetical protein
MAPPAWKGPSTSGIWWAVDARKRPDHITRHVRSCWQDDGLVMIAINKLANLFCLALLVTAHASSLLAQNTPSLPIELREHDFVIKDFRFQSDQTLPELKVHYRTFGTPHKSASGTIDNAILLLHGTTETSKEFLAPSFATELYGEGQPLDASRSTAISTWSRPNTSWLPNIWGFSI